MSERDGIYDITWDWPVFLSQLFGFAVIVGVLMKWVAPPIKSAMRRSQDTISAQLEESSQASARLAAAERAFAEAVAAAATEVAQIQREARDDAERIVAELRETAAAEVERVRIHGMDRVARVQRQLRAELGHDLTVALLDRAESVVRERFDSVAARSASIDRFLDELASAGERGS
ncbi:hypothetical protein NDR87_12710 [Nocardia sp. CDC159]|uniref:ATP synthase subunit b n=1 Tax=Nocardia pulmonis TaxID=2951408 RepID=A0A9X2IZ95_9NOCA|nr:MULTISPECIES: hypothetical protein [Nocardia]MCM6774716.1 hypothetical protein [Nocardia pulmonis]MCM6787219.1 hypothetical protein [Nocardia sp. CDC159]